MMEIMTVEETIREVARAMAPVGVVVVVDPPVMVVLYHTVLTVG